MSAINGSFRKELAEFTPACFREKLPLLYKLRSDFEKAEVRMDIERALWYTRTYRERETVRESHALKRAHALKRYLAERTVVYHDDNLLGGGSTSHPVGAPLYTEFLSGLSIWPELDTISKREFNPQRLSKEDARRLNFEILPYWMDRNIVELVRREDPEGIDLINRLVIFSMSKVASVSHTTPAYRLILEKGALTLIEEAKGRAETAESPETADFHASVVIALEGLLIYARRLAEAAREKVRTAVRPEDAGRWRSMADVLDRVPAYPAETFREALNSLWLAHACILAENANIAVNPGRIDQILLPYFRTDLAAGRLSVGEALELAGCLWLKIGDNVDVVPQAAENLFGGAGSVPAVTLGGVTPEGEDAVNELTWLFLKTTELMPIRNPNVNVRIHAGKNPVDFRQETAKVILSTKSIPAVYNDEANIAVLKAQGQSRAHANDYAIVGCVELASAGRDFSASAAIFIMLYTVLYMALHDGRTPVTGPGPLGPSTGEAKDFRSMEDFWRAFEAQLDWMAARATGLNNLFGRKCREYYQTPLMSALFEGPAEKGMDVVDGGAVYNASGVTVIGFSDVVDSINALEDICFSSRPGHTNVAPDDFCAAVDSDFTGTTPIVDGLPLLEYCRTKAPKYGTDDATARKNGLRMVELIYRSFNGRKNYRDGNYRVAYWTMTNHAGYGFVSPALPNGRRSHEAFSSGITPCSQVVTDISTVMGAVARLAGPWIPGGYAFNLKLSPIEVTSRNAANFAACIESYFALGGQQVQFNIYDYKKLRELKDHPERNEDILVRVSGYSAWFKSLNVHMQEELIRRSQYDLTSGRLIALSPDEVHDAV